MTSDSLTEIPAERLLLASKAVDALRALDQREAVFEEMLRLPELERIADVPGYPLPGPGGYRFLTLPSGYMVTYRRLTDEEKKERGQDPYVDVLLVADLRPVPSWTAQATTGPATASGV